MDRKSFISKISEKIELTGEIQPGQTVVELAADRRVLIENHGGVTQYSESKICVKVSFGCLAVTGFNLELAKMDKEQLVICGHIESISLIRRSKS